MGRLAALPLLLLLPGAVRAHGSMTFPRPRNAADAQLSPWSNWSSPPSQPRFSANGLDTAGACPITTGKGEANALKSNGQSCYWVGPTPSRTSGGRPHHPIPHHPTFNLPQG